MAVSRPINSRHRHTALRSSRIDNAVLALSLAANKCPCRFCYFAAGLPIIEAAFGI